VRAWACVCVCVCACMVRACACVFVAGAIITLQEIEIGSSNFDGSFRMMM